MPKKMHGQRECTHSVLPNLILSFHFLYKLGHIFFVWAKEISFLPCIHIATYSFFIQRETHTTDMLNKEKKKERGGCF